MPQATRLQPRQLDYLASGRGQPSQAPQRVLDSNSRRIQPSSRRTSQQACHHEIALATEGSAVSFAIPSEFGIARRRVPLSKIAHRPNRQGRQGRTKRCGDDMRFDLLADQTLAERGGFFPPLKAKDFGSSRFRALPISYRFGENPSLEMYPPLDTSEW
jgi:hypothetical protein